MVDYHLHSEYSMDSSEKIEAICQKALEYGVKDIAITDHVDFPIGYAEDIPDFDTRKKEIIMLQDRYFGKLTIRSGVEIGQPHRDIAGFELFKKNLPFDLMIASIHSVGGYPAFKEIEFSKENLKPFLRAYLREMKEMLSFCDYDVVGHVNYPFRYIPQELLPICYEDDVLLEFREVFEIIVKAGRTIEVNTSGYRTCLEEAMPSYRMLKLFRECGGRAVSIGSDGHSVRSALLNLERGAEMIKEAGLEVLEL